jgi:hypothetical protein
LEEGELDNTQPGKVTGWLRFAGLPDKVTLDLEGDFEPDIRGRRIAFKSVYLGRPADAEEYMEGFHLRQTGRVGHITLGGPPQTWTEFPYIEWCSPESDRVVMYLEPHQVAVIDEPVEVVAVEPGLA